MQAVIGGCRSCPFPCPRSRQKAAAAESPQKTRASTPGGNATATTWVQPVRASGLAEGQVAPKPVPTARAPAVGASHHSTTANLSCLVTIWRFPCDETDRKDRNSPAGGPSRRKEEPGFLWASTAGDLTLCILLFILFFAFSWGGLVLWDEVFINTSDTAADTVHAVLTGAGRMAVSSAVLAVTAVYIGKAIVIMAKFFARRRSRP